MQYAVPQRKPWKKESHRSPKFCFGAFLRKYPATPFPPIIKRH